MAVAWYHPYLTPKVILPEIREISFSTNATIACSWKKDESAEKYVVKRKVYLRGWEGKCGRLQ
jgi:hypothetical protein